MKNLFTGQLGSDWNQRKAIAMLIIGIHSAHHHCYSQDELSTLRTKAKAHLAAGEIDKAIELGEKVVRETLNKTGAESLDSAIASSELSDYYLAANQHGKAEQLLKSSIPVFESGKQPAPDRAVTSLRNLGGLYLKTDRLNDAIHYLSRSIEQYQTNQVDEPLSLARSQKMLGSAHYSNGDIAKAQRLWSDSIKTFEKQSKNLTEFANSLSNLGNLHLTQNQPKDAKTYLTKSRKIWQLINPEAKELNEIETVLKEIENKSNSKPVAKVIPAPQPVKQIQKAVLIKPMMAEVKETELANEPEMAANAIKAAPTLSAESGNEIDNKSGPHSAGDQATDSPEATSPAPKPKTSSKSKSSSSSSKSRCYSSKRKCSSRYYKRSCSSRSRRSYCR